MCRGLGPRWGLRENLEHASRPSYLRWISIHASCCLWAVNSSSSSKPRAQACRPAQLGPARSPLGRSAMGAP